MTHNMNRACFTMSKELHRTRTTAVGQSIGSASGREPLGGCSGTVRAELIGYLKACMAEIYIHIDARMADYIRTHP